MRAFGLTALGVPPLYLEVPVPQPRADEVRIRVRSSSVNPVDQMIASGFFASMQEYRLPAVIGRDVCGTVEAVGDSVTRLAVGDEVWGFIKRDHVGDGTFAEYVTCPENHFITVVPRGISVTEAGVLGLACITALDCLDSLQPEPGQVILVNGAAGGVGSYTVQLAVAAGLTVVATARPGLATDFVRDLGAHDVVSRYDDPMAAVRDLVPAGVDMLVDLTRWSDPAEMSRSQPDGQSEGRSDGRSEGRSDGRSEGRRSLARFATGVLRPGGRLTSTTNAVDPDLLGDLHGTNIHSVPSVASLERIRVLVEAGRVRSAVDATYSFDAIPEVFEALAVGALGKLAVSFG